MDLVDRVDEVDRVDMSGLHCPQVHQVHFVHYVHFVHQVHFVHYVHKVHRPLKQLPFKIFFKVLASQGIGIARHLLRRAFRDDLAAFVACIRSQIDHMVGIFNDSPCYAR